MKKMTIQDKFGVIEDPRHQSYVKYDLSDILVLVMCAVLCGLDQLGDIVTYAQNKAPFFEQYFGIHQIPSKPTFSRVLSLLDPEKTGEVILKIMRENFDTLGPVLAVDGKAIRSTTEKGNPHSALQLLSAYLTESGVTLGQKAIHDKTNEIPVFQELLNTLNVQGKIITADAMHCQKETCAKIIEKGGHYIFGLKENQKTLYKDVKLFIESKINQGEIETHSSTNYGHGRYEKRDCYKVTTLDWLTSHSDWAGLRTVFAVKRTVKTKHKETEEISFYISSCDETPENLSKIVREHWKIESLHWMLDVVFSEDTCQLQSDNGNEVLNLFRKLALLTHRSYLNAHSKKISVKQNLLQCLVNDKELLNLLQSL